MLAKVLSGAVVGLSAVPVTVEVDIAEKGLPSFTIVGLPDKAVEESKERVRSAIRNSGGEFPGKRITVNLAPADLPKIGPAYDVPIALGILIASKQIPIPKEIPLCIGELSLDGALRHTNGVLPIALLVKEHSYDSIIIPSEDAREASIISDITIYPAISLLSLFQHFSGFRKITPEPHISFAQLSIPRAFDFDFADIHGQEQVKRASEIAAAGAHNLYLQGVPGSGKTLIARTLPSILPELTENEALDVTKIYSVTGNLPVGESVIKYRPFRAPHHTTSRIGLIGGGTHPVPGEISLAHRGVLFLDEFPEFPRNVLEALRQPLEDGFVSISRAAGTVTYPAKFTLVAASNPCPCGNFGSIQKKCTCLPGIRDRYQKRISGPIMDRIDLHVSVSAVDVQKLTDQGGSKTESSDVVRERVQRARNIQSKRFSGTIFAANNDLSTKAVKEFCPLSTDVISFLRQAVVKLGLSARSYYRVIKVSRTIADLAGDKDIGIPHVGEALLYRPREN